MGGRFLSSSDKKIRALRDLASEKKEAMKSLDRLLIESETRMIERSELETIVTKLQHIDRQIIDAAIRETNDQMGSNRPVKSEFRELLFSTFWEK